MKGVECMWEKISIVIWIILFIVSLGNMIYCIANHDIVRLSSSVIWTIGTMILMIRDIIHLKKKK